MQSIVAALPAIIFLFLLTPWGRESCNAPEIVCAPYSWLIPVLIVFAFYFKKHMNHFAVLAILTVLALQAQLGILQFITQHDFNLYLLGESPLAPTINGIAKFSLGDEKIVRAYGLMPHANTFGGVMLIAVVFASFLPRSLSRTAFTGLFSLALLLSFSRSALLGYGIYLLFKRIFDRPLPLRYTLSIALLFIALFTPLLWQRSTDPNSVAMTERLRGYSWSLSTLENQPFWKGSGIGTYRETLRQHLDTNDIHYSEWEIAPVHSAPLLIATELGIAASLLLLVVIIGFTIRTQYWYMLIFLPPLLLDHYFVTNPAALFPLIMLYTFWNGGGIPKIAYRSSKRTAR